MKKAIYCILIVAISAFGGAAWVLHNPENNLIDGLKMLKECEEETLESCELKAFPIIQNEKEDYVIPEVHGDIVYSKGLRSLLVGQCGYVPPWAFTPSRTVAITGRLDMTFSPSDTLGGTSTMKVCRLKDGLWTEKYKIYIPEDYIYE